MASDRGALSITSPSASPTSRHQPPPLAPQKEPGTVPAELKAEQATEGWKSISRVPASMSGDDGSWARGREALRTADPRMAELIDADPGLDPDAVFDSWPSDLW